MAKSTNTDGVFTRKDRDGFWISWNDAQGRRKYRKTNARTLAEARKLRAAELVKVEQNKALGVVPPSDEPFEAVGKRFLKHQKARLTDRAYERERAIVEDHLIGFFKTSIAAVRRVDVQRYVTHRMEKVSTYSVQKELNVLKHLLRLAVEWELIPFNPAQGVKSPKVPAGRVRYLQAAELRLLLETCPTWLRPIVGFAVSTGMRRSEILGLRWVDVDLANERLMLPQTKNGDRRIVYLNQLSMAVLRSCDPALPTSRIFGDKHTPERISVAFTRACSKARIVDFRFHDLRHTAASWLRMQGADIHTVAQLLGHKDLRMAARYQHLSPAYLSEAVKKLDGVFGDSCYPGVTKELKAIEAGPVSD